MKKIINPKALLFSVTLLVTAIFLGYCNSRYNTEDSREAAEERNEAAFETSDQKKDAKFLVKAAEINLEEIELGKLAQQKSTMADVKELGKMMAESHTKSQEELSALARKKMISIPVSLTEDSKETYKKFNNKSVTEFDKDYCDLTVKGHKDAISLFEKAATESNDAEIKEWARTSLNTLRSHLDHATACQRKLEKI